MDYALVAELEGAGYKPFVALKEANGRWLGSAAGYHSIHQWLKRNYGSPTECEQCGTKGHKEKGGRWSIHCALKQGAIHSHDRANYLGLCRTCHGKYDWNEKKTEQMKIAASLSGGPSKAKSLIAKQKQRDQYGHFATATA